LPPELCPAIVELFFSTILPARIYAFSQTGCEKVAPAGQFETGGRLPVTCPSMTDGLSTLYQDLLGGSYDCVDRIVLNAYFRTGHDPGGFRLWWRALTGSDETLENAYLMRPAGLVAECAVTPERTASL